MCEEIWSLRPSSTYSTQPNHLSVREFAHTLVRYQEAEGSEA